MRKAQMIPIRYKNPESKTVADLCDHILPKKKSKQYEELDKWCSNNMKCSFREIVLSDYDKLNSLKKTFDKINGSKSFPYRAYMITTLYGHRFSKCRKEFIEQFEGNLQVCPYCGRNYINRLKSYRQYEIDHFFPKDKYPIFAVSLYNLIPVCPSCNRRKANKDFSYSPHNHKYCSAGNLSHFWYSITGTDFLTDLSKLKVNIDHISMLQDNIKDLELKEAYSFHAREVQDMLLKAEIYTDDYIDDILENHDKMFDTREQLVDLIYGISSDESCFLTESLSKFKTDIYNQIISGY